MLTSKQRAFLRKTATAIPASLNVGKNELTPEFTKAVDEALEKQELIKIGILNNCMTEPGEIADILHERTRSEVVALIGRKIILYRKSSKKPVIELP